MTNDEDTSTAQDSGASAQQADELAKLRQKIEELERQLAEMQKFKDLAARAQADLQNAKARVERESMDLRKYASEGVFLKLLPTIDNFNRAFKHLPEDLKSHEWVKGITAIEQDLMKTLGEMGLKKFDSIGAKADPACEEIVTMGPGEEGIVTEMLEDGWTLHNKVIRPAKVKVGDGTARS
jgi:molecular chaperone GrpE